MHPVDRGAQARPAGAPDPGGQLAAGAGLHAHQARRQPLAAAAGQERHRVRGHPRQQEPARAHRAPWRTSRRRKSRSWWPRTSPRAAWTSNSCPTWSITNCRTCPRTTSTASAAPAAPAPAARPSPWSAPTSTACLRDIERLIKRQIPRVVIAGFEPGRPGAQADDIETDDRPPRAHAPVAADRPAAGPQRPTADHAAVQPAATATAQPAATVPAQPAATPPAPAHRARAHRAPAHARARRRATKTATAMATRWSRTAPRASPPHPRPHPRGERPTSARCAPARNRPLNSRAAMPMAMAIAAPRTATRVRPPRVPTVPPPAAARADRHAVVNPRWCAITCRRVGPPTQRAVAAASLRGEAIVARRHQSPLARARGRGAGERAV